MHPALLYVPGVRLSQPELSAARIDGHVVEMGDAYVPADLVEGPDVRASAIAMLAHPGTVMCGPSAAWIHGAGDAPPSVHHMKRCVERRVRPRTSARLIFHDTLLPREDVMSVGGIDVSRPARTMADLATTLHRDPRVLPWMDALAMVCPEVTEAAIATVEAMQRVPGSRAGLAALKRLAARTR